LFAASIGVTCLGKNLLIGASISFVEEFLFKICLKQMARLLSLVQKQVSIKETFIVLLLVFTVLGKT
jgi:hypothetical protein